jgi:hypothetical protein
MAMKKTAWMVLAGLKVAVLTTAVMWDEEAQAQIHWDVGIQGGAMKRFVTGGEAGADPKIGPAFQLTGHMALIPLVRVGLYAATDISPATGIAARHFYEGGLHAKFAPPLLGGPWRTWVALGIGYAYTYAPSYTAQVLFAGDTQPSTLTVDTATGGMLEISPAIGIGYRIGSVTPFAELGGRFGMGFSGTMYDSNAASCGYSQIHPMLQACEPYFGQDSFAVSLSVGLSLEP